MTSYSSEALLSTLCRQYFRRGGVRELGVGVLTSRTFCADFGKGIKEKLESTANDNVGLEQTG